MVVQLAILTYPTMVFPVPMGARITKYINKYVRRDLCLIYISIFLFLEPSVSQKNAKNQCAVLPGISVTVHGCTASNVDLHDHGLLLLTCSTGPME
jgi:hypothetical protein